MKAKIIFLLLAGVFSISNLCGHDVHQTEGIPRKWTVEKECQTLEGFFQLYKNDKVFIETSSGTVVEIPLVFLSAEDQEYVKKKTIQIRELNTASLIHNPQKEKAQNKGAWLALAIFSAAGLLLVLSSGKKAVFLVPLLSLVFILVGSGFSKNALRPLQSATSPALIDSAFSPFKPKISTYWDGTYFYVESLGIPDHEMMVGISNHGWQRQVPIPQCYIGTNAWPVPLNPFIAASPVPVNANHFTKGAIAIAVNGVPIFNPYTNTGVDAYLDGQLDNYGGHSGRADDYHYHIAPLHLYNQTSSDLPIAYALDGFAVYGTLEPDGSPMTGLDANHGHYGSNGVYHYHGTNSAPYMIGNMVGQITEDASNQIVPQAQSTPVRPGQNPLNGALITSCAPNASNSGYTLAYTLGGETDSIVYNWTGSGVYSFHYYSTAGTIDSVFNGSSPCVVPVGLKKTMADASVAVFPNPSSDKLYIQCTKETDAKNVKGLYLYNAQGKIIRQVNGMVSEMDLRALVPGTYVLKIDFGSYPIIRKIIVQ